MIDDDPISEVRRLLKYDDVASCFECNIQFYVYFRVLGDAIGSIFFSK